MVSERHLIVSLLALQVLCLLSLAGTSVCIYFQGVFRVFFRMVTVADLYSNPLNSSRTRERGAAARCGAAEDAAPSRTGAAGRTCEELR